MRAAILCPGPSLRNVEERDLAQFAGMVLAINGAIEHPARAAFWLCRDPKAAYLHLPLALKRPAPILVHPATWDQTGSLHAIEAWPWDKQRAIERMTRWAFRDEDVQARCDFLHGYASWRRFTLTTAIAWLFSVGFREVQLFGADLAGTGTYSGRACYADEETAAARWRRERNHLEMLTGLAGGDGLEVIRRTDLLPAP